MQERPLVMLIGGHVKTLRIARELGVGVVLIQHPRRFDPAAAALVEGLIVADYTDWETLAPLAEAAHRVWKFPVILSISEPGLLPAAQASDLLGLPGTTAEVAGRLRDKAAMRAHLRSTGAAGLEAERLTAESDLTAFGAAAGYPFVVKPTQGSAGFGIFTVASAGDAPRVWREVNRLRAVAEPVSDGLYDLDDFLMEEYVHGPEYSVETFSFGGRHVRVAITEKLVDDRTRTELGHAMPARLDDAVAARIDRAVGEFLDAIGLTDGPAHTELRLDARGPLVIESHNRVGGGFIHDLVRAVYGIDLEELTLAWAAGIGAELPGPPPAVGGGAVRFVHAPAGRVTAVGDLCAVGRRPGVLLAGLAVVVGDVVRPLANNWDRLGHVVVTAADVTAAVTAANEALAELSPTISEEEQR